MGQFSTSDRHKNHRISSQTIAGLGLAALVAVTLLCAGCHKPKTVAVQTPVDQNTNQAAANPTPVFQQPSPAGSAAVAAQPPAPPDLKELDRSLLRWILANRRRPQNFEEFAATANVTIPAPPAGKKYVLGKDMHIQLVNR